MRITHLRADHVENPLGYRLERPVLTWTAEGTGRCRAARVQWFVDGDVSSPVYDSGERADLNGLGFAPPVTIAPRTRYHWRVQVMADSGESAWSELAWLETGKRGEPWAARWIAAPFDKDVHPLFSRGFSLREKPVRARVYAVGLGLYELSVNGRPASDEVLAPFYNDYGLWLQTQTYDVTALLGPGENRLEALLGNGWYKGRFTYVEGAKALYGDRMQLLLELRVEYADGTEWVLGTDESWRCRPSPVLESGIYDGETYDARLQAPGAEAAAVLVDAPAGETQDRLSPPLRVCRRLPVAQLIVTPKGERVLDFGQVMTGWVEARVALPRDGELRLAYGELLQNGCFYQDNLRSAKQAYRYVSDGTPAVARPHFTFYGFRYVKVEGPAQVSPQDFTACVVHSDLECTGRLETSNPKVNRLIQNAFWGQLGNFVDVPTDCPQRDERLGWTGDAHVFAPTASFHLYTPAFLDKYLYDMLLEQRALDGAVPHVVPDALDQAARQRGQTPDAFGSCVWGDAATGIPWTLYQFFGDRDMLRRHYENMRLWTDWIRRQDETHCGGRRLWMCGFHFADWLALDNPDRESPFGGTDAYFVASAYYYRSALLTSQAARALGLEAEAGRYQALADEIREAFGQEFFTPTGRLAQSTQTALVLALALDLAPENARQRLREDLRRRLQERRWHLDTGFVGTYHLMRTLTQNGMADVAYTLLFNEDYPSWLYEVNMGATTVWERWNSVLPNGLVSDTGMNSMNHYAYGSVVEWMYRDMCGLNAAQPGFRRARIAPHTDARLDWARCEYQSASGLYACGWRRTPQGVTYDIRVPFDCEADFIPPEPPARLVLNGKPAALAQGRLTLGPGDYCVECLADQPKGGTP